MRQFFAPLLAALFATSALAGGAPQEAQAAGSDVPKLRAEAIHLARQHGLPDAKQPEAQRAGHIRSQMLAEEIHLKKQHGSLNLSADERMLRDAARL
jgi:hypothetical protein